MGKVLIVLGLAELFLGLAHKRPLTAYASHPLYGPLLSGLAEAFKVHLEMERK